MRSRWSGIVPALGLLAALGLVTPACVIRAHAQPLYSADTAPPPPRYQHPAPRRGFVWIRGHWQRYSGQWHWKHGYWRRRRASYTWQPGHWQHRGNRYHWVEGHWVASANANANVGGAVVVRDHRPPPRPNHTVVVRDHRYPMTAPPAPRYQHPGTRNGFVWKRGRYYWQGGRWVWHGGHWQRARAGFRWKRGHWHRGPGGRFVWAPGGWVNRPAPRFPIKHPPPPHFRHPGTRNGFVWMPGRYYWQGGRWVWHGGHWQRARAGFRWKRGHWYRNGKGYKWAPGRWVKRRGRARVHVRDHRHHGRRNEEVRAHRGH